MAAGARSVMIEGRNFPQRLSTGAAARPIPRRGQVKVAILVGLAHTVASLFSHTSRRAYAATHIS